MRRATALALVIACCVALGSCTPRNALGTGSTTCVRAIPVATDQVSHKGKPEGVREVKASNLAKRYPQFAQYDNQLICVVAFSGNFQPGDVPDAQPQRAGHYALVAVQAKTQKVVGAFVTDRLPLRFRHPV